MANTNQSIDQPSRDNRQMAMLCHLLAFTGLLLPFCNFIVPLIIWLQKREDHPLIDDQGKESLNFQISFTIYFLILIAGLAVSLIDNPENFLRWGLLSGLMFILFLVYCVLIVVASVKASEGHNYRYPITIRFF